MAVESGRTRGKWTWLWFGQRCGFERSPIVHAGSLYMDRWILYVFGFTLRLHKICRPDFDRALHNHPFAFVTFPLGEYHEIVGLSPDDGPYGPEPDWLRTGPNAGWVNAWQRVRAFVPQFRGIDYRHRIVGLPNGPVYTIVITGRYRQKWGFFPNHSTFVPWDSTEAEEPLQ